MPDESSGRRGLQPIIDSQLRVSIDCRRGFESSPWLLGPDRAICSEALALTVHWAGGMQVGLASAPRCFSRRSEPAKVSGKLAGKNFCWRCEAFGSILSDFSRRW